jgi:predicted ATP-dependent endonuclease of OLD family
VSVFADGLALKACLQAFVDDPSIPDPLKEEAKRMLRSSTADEEIAAQEERFRYQLWLDSDRAAMFFADRVLLVEGATEGALFSWLLARDWHDLTRHRIAVVDVLGKYNFHRYMALLERFGIPYGLILDDDDEKTHHKAVNEMLRHRSVQHRLAAPVFIPRHLEAFLGLTLPGRDDLKPVQVMKALEAATLEAEKLNALRNKFCEALALSQASA